MKRLIILDLDNTLIYSDFSDRLKVRKLFKYRDFLYVYERPYAKEFIQLCHQLGEVMIFTLAEWDYADQVSEHLNIRPTEYFRMKSVLTMKDQSANAFRINIMKFMTGL